LRKAREALGKYQNLKEKREQDHKKIKTLEQTLRHREQSAAYDKDTTKAVENSLLAQVQDLVTYVEFLKCVIIEVDVFHLYNRKASLSSVCVYTDRNRCLW